MDVTNVRDINLTATTASTTSHARVEAAGTTVRATTHGAAHMTAGAAGAAHAASKSATTDSAAGRAKPRLGLTILLGGQHN
jgi:hypothetical protein